MSNSHITVHDFENICRTCLSKEDLKPLYVKFPPSMICLAGKLMSCTALMFIEEDELPGKICANCICEINQAFSFAKHCEKTDTILRNCLKNYKIQLNTPPSQNVVPIELNTQIEIKIKEEIVDPLETNKEELNFPNLHQTEQEIEEDYENVQEAKTIEHVKIECEEYVEEEDAKVEYENAKSCNASADKSCEKNEIYFTTSHVKVESLVAEDENVEEVKNIEDIKIECEEYVDEKIDKENAKRCNDLTDESNEKNNENQNETYSEKSDNLGPRLKRRCTKSQKEKKSYKDEDSEGYEDPGDESYHEDDDQDETNSEKSDNSDLRLKRFQTQEEKTKEKDGILNFKTIIGKAPNQNVSSNIQPAEYNEAYTSQTILKKHYLNHGEKKFKCKVCGICFASRGCLKSHLKIHPSVRPFGCDECDKACKTLHHLKSHKLTHKREKMVTCTVCSKVFAGTGVLKIHMRIHTGEKPFVCTVCNKAFSRPCLFKEHMRIHTGEKPHVCSICSKGFIKLKHLRVHMSSHTGKTPFACSVCNKGFFESYNLRVHMSMHTGEKSHICTYCSKAFSTLRNLREHTRTHTGEKPYSCTVCSKTFSFHSTLGKHMRTHTGEKPNICTVCSKAFSQSCHLSQHMKIHAREQNKAKVAEETIKF